MGDSAEIKDDFTISKREDFYEAEEPQKETEETAAEEKDELLLATQYYTPSHIMAKQEDYDAMFKSQHVFTIPGKEEQIQTPQMKLREDYNALTAAAKSKTLEGRILRGRIIGVHQVNPDKSTATPVADVSFGHGMVKVIIPYYLLVDTDFKDAYQQNAGVVDRYTNILKGMINAEIEFVVRQVDKKSQLVVGDRLEALSLRGYQYFRPHVIQGTDQVKPAMIGKGQLVQSEIIFVSKYSVLISAFGIDQFLSVNTDPSVNEVDYFYIDCREKFTPGQAMLPASLIMDDVKFVTKKVLNNSYVLPKANLSLKRATSNPAEEYYNRVVVTENEDGTINRFKTIGYVTKLTDTRVYMRLFDALNGVEACAKMPSFIPEKGKPYPVEVYNKKTQEVNGQVKYMCDCYFTR